MHKHFPAIRNCITKKSKHAASVLPFFTRENKEQSRVVATGIRSPLIQEIDKVSFARSTGRRNRPITNRPAPQPVAANESHHRTTGASAVEQPTRHAAAAADAQLFLTVKIQEKTDQWQQNMRA